MSSQVPPSPSPPHESHAGTRAGARPDGAGASPNGGPAEASAAHRRAQARARKAQRWAPSPAIGAKELVYAFLAGLVLAVITSWPLVLHMGSRIAPDLG